MTSCRRAYVLGSNGPPDLGQLDYALADADRLTKVLGSRRCGFSVSAPDPGSQALDVWSSLYKSIEQCNPGDSFVCAFSGHGILDRGELFLLWHDSKLGSLLQTALPASQLFAALDRCNATNKLLILDCCHAGGILSKGFRAAGAPMSEIAGEQNYLLLLASERLELARELKPTRGGFLTGTICDVLEDVGLAADQDNDGQISIYDLDFALKAAATKHNSANKKHSVPTPILFGKQKGGLLLTQRPTWQPWKFILDDIEMTLLPIVANGRRDKEVLALSTFPITNRQYRRYIGGEAEESKRGFFRSRNQGTSPSGSIYDASARRWVAGFEPWSDPRFAADDQPVVCVSYAEAMGFCSWMSERVGGGWWGDDRASASGPRIPWSGRDSRYCVRLPTPEMWDVAAFGRVAPHAPTRKNSQPRRERRPQSMIHQLGDAPLSNADVTNRTNELGLIDLFGNIWEWCLSSTNLNHFSAIIAIGGGSEHFGDVNPRTVEIRGGGYLDDLALVRPSLRAEELPEGLHTRHSDLGFRIAVSLDPDGLFPEVQDALREHAVEVAMDAYTHVASGQ